MQLRARLMTAHAFGQQRMQLASKVGRSSWTACHAIVTRGHGRSIRGSMSHVVVRFDNWARKRAASATSGGTCGIRACA